MNRLALLLSSLVGLSSPPAPAQQQLDELWIGSWTTHNVLRLDWQTGESRGIFIPTGSGGLNRSHSFSFGPDGHLYVASYQTSSIKRFHGQTGDYLNDFVAPGDHGLLNTHSVVWTEDGRLLVAGENSNTVNAYDAEGGFLDLCMLPGEGGLDGPELITLGPDGLYYLTGQSNAVYRLDPQNCRFVDVFIEDDPATPQLENGGLAWAHGITFGPDGNLYVASSMNNRVIRFDGKTGEPMGNFVAPGSGGLNFPIGIAFGPDAHLYVASFQNSRILRYDGQTGAFLGLVAFLPALGLSNPLDMKFMPGPTCFADLDDSGALDFSDVLAFVVAFAAQDPDADLGEPAGVFDFTDVSAFLTLFGTGCP